MGGVLPVGLLYQIENDLPVMWNILGAAPPLVITTPGNTGELTEGDYVVLVGKGFYDLVFFSDKGTNSAGFPSSFRVRV